MAIKVVQLTESAVLTQVVSDGFFVTKICFIYIFCLWPCLEL